MTQLVNSPTREENILDLVLVSSPDIADNLIVVEPFSDHYAVTFSIPRWPFEHRKIYKVTYSYSKADWVYLRELLHYIPWYCAFLEDDINIIWSAWSDLLFTAIDEYIPKRQVKSWRNAPWITIELIKLCKKRVFGKHESMSHESMTHESSSKFKMADVVKLGVSTD